MAIPNINTSRPPTSTIQIAKPTTTPPVHKGPSQQDRHESVMVELSAQARDLQRAEENKLNASAQHAERIEALNRSDQAASEKLDTQTREETRALEMRQQQNAQENKRINTYA
jgi:anti-sigma28 factor (negative regulator of flagellin synthesis)